MSHTEEPLFEINPRGEVEVQVDAFFAPAFRLIREQHHPLLLNLERHMISALKAALRLPATEPVPPNPINWPYDSFDRLAYSLPPDVSREIEAERKRRR
jgi:hypothetical protein